MNNPANRLNRPANRRSFIQRGLRLAGGVSLATGVSSSSAVAATPLTPGDAAILRFLAAAEIIESDLWVQYNELGGVQDSEVPGIAGGSKPYTDALVAIDGDMPQYIHDNTEDEISHSVFINGYLASKGAAPVHMEQFRILQGSKATGARQVGRLTN